jgi:hypothetical protein
MSDGELLKNLDDLIRKNNGGRRTGYELNRFTN